MQHAPGDGKEKRIFLKGLVAVALVAAAGAAWRAGSGRDAKPAGVPSVLAAPAAVPKVSRTLRVVLQRVSGEPWVGVRVAAKGKAADPQTGRQLAVLPAGANLTVSADPENGRVLLTGSGVKIWEPQIRLTSGDGLVRVGSKAYPGTLVARLVGSNVILVNEVDVERYMEGVLPGELPASFAMEAQKALAVAGRTYALRNRGKHAAEGADVCDTVHCQMYLGHTRVSPRGLAAVRATRGLIAVHQGELVCTFYSADCGGQTTFGTAVPLRDMPKQVPAYLRPVRDCPKSGGRDYCAASNSHWWSQRFSMAELEDVFNSQPDTWVGRLKSVRFSGRDESGRVTGVRLVGGAVDEGKDGQPATIERYMTGWAFRMQVGPRRVKSTMMRIAKQTPDVLVLTGSGNGHGLGLCQHGANGMASAPHRRTFRQILEHYYPGTEIRPLS